MRIDTRSVKCSHVVHISLARPTKQTAHAYHGLLQVLLGWTCGHRQPQQWRQDLHVSVKRKKERRWESAERFLPNQIFSVTDATFVDAFVHKTKTKRTQTGALPGKAPNTLNYQPWCVCGTNKTISCSAPYSVPEQINLQLAASDVLVVSFVTFQQALPHHPPEARWGPAAAAGTAADDNAAAPVISKGVAHWYSTSHSAGAKRNYVMNFVRFTGLTARQKYTYSVRRRPQHPQHPPSTIHHPPSTVHRAASVLHYSRVFWGFFATKFISMTPTTVIHVHRSDLVLTVRSGQRTLLSVRRKCQKSILSDSPAEYVM